MKISLGDLRLYARNMHAALLREGLCATPDVWRNVGQNIPVGEALPEENIAVEDVPETDSRIRLLSIRYNCPIGGVPIEITVAPGFNNATSITVKSERAPSLYQYQGSECDGNELYWKGFKDYPEALRGLEELASGI